MLIGSDQTEPNIERDLEVVVDSWWKCWLSMQQWWKKQSAVLRVIRKGIKIKTSNIEMLFYKTVVLLHFKYCVWFWLLYVKKDIAELEKMQKCEKSGTI